MKPTEYTPFICLNAEKGIVEIGGRTCPENVQGFYEPIMEWLEEYLNDPQFQTVFQFKFTFLNSASTKKILEILKMSSFLKHKGYISPVHWYYKKGDTGMLALGMELAAIAEIEMEYFAN